MSEELGRLDMYLSSIATTRYNRRLVLTMANGQLLFFEKINSYFVLSTLFVSLGAVISQISWFRTTSASYSMFFVQIVSYWLGNLMARTLPSTDVNLGFIKFNLNPAPFSIKEHVLITLAYVSWIFYFVCVVTRMLESNTALACSFSRA